MRPVVKNLLSMATVNIGSRFEVPLGNNPYLEQNNDIFDGFGQELELSVTLSDGEALPDWMSFNTYQLPEFERLGFFAAGLALGVTVEDEVAYLSVTSGGASGLHIIDISDPTAPQAISHFMPGQIISSFVKQGDIAYIGHNDGLDNGALVALDLSDLDHPVTRSNITFPNSGIIWDVVLEGELLYVTAGDVHIVNYTDPDNPSLVSYLPIPDMAFEVKLKEGIAFVPSRLAGLTIFNVTNATSPYLLSHLAIPGSAISIHIEEDIAYLGTARDTKILHIIDISNPVSPKILNDFDTPGSGSSDGSPWQVTVQARIAYIASGAEGMQVVDIGNQESLQLLANIEFDGGYVYGLDCNQDNIYVANSHGLHILQIKAPGWSISGVPQTEMSETWHFHISATNVLGEVATTPFQLYIKSLPEIANPLTDQQVVPGEAFQYHFLNDLFQDPDDEIVNIQSVALSSGAPLPPWLNSVRPTSNTPQLLGNYYSSAFAFSSIPNPHRHRSTSQLTVPARPGTIRGFHVPLKKPVGLGAYCRAGDALTTKA